MIKLTLYIVSVLNIVLILLFSPIKNSTTGFVDRSRLLNVGYNQVLMQQVIGFGVLIFFILVLILLFQGL
uniref:Preprotein-translocase subunit g n=1 Tax=Palisada sp. TaxID=1955416 RepID=A0A1Z1MRK8_9FLOR|nr:preprotein-translocase subunit g [Palisada sp.]